MGSKGLPAAVLLMAMADQKNKLAIEVVACWAAYGTNSAAEAAPIRRVKCHYARPTRRRIVRDGEDTRGIGDVDPDRGLFGPSPRTTVLL